MIRMCEGSIFDADVEALVNPVNTVGVMGAGLAKEFKKRYPWMFHEYAAVCARHELPAGGVLVCKPQPYAWDQRLVICLASKAHFAERSRINYVDSGLRALIMELARLGIRSVAVPALGCGLGGLDWADVLPLIEKRFGGGCGIDAHVYPPKETK